MEKRYHLCVKGVVRDAEGRWLLLLRSRSAALDPDTWDLPGGKLDPGELFDDAFRREVHEETGLSVRIVGIAGAIDWEQSERMVAYLFVEAAPEQGDVTLSDEHSAYAWVAPCDVTSYDLAAQYRRFAGDYLFTEAAEKQ